MDLPDIAETRITFLNSDLDVANTFVELSRTELDLDNREHCEALLEKARVALQTVRRLAATPPRITGDDAAQLAEPCDDLESSIQSVRSS